jgi:AcrR family transcriptional regulator
MSLSKRDKLTEFNRGNIINAAKALFEANGVRQTTMDAIAKKAGYSKSTIYIYFKSKDELYNHILFERMVLLRDRFKAAIKKKAGFDENFLAIGRVLTDFRREYSLYFSSIMGEISVDEEEFEKCPILRDVYVVSEDLNVILSDMIIGGMESGILRPDLDPISTIFTLWAGLCGIIKMAEQKERYFRDKLRLSKRKYLDYSFKMLLNSVKV